MVFFVCEGCNETLKKNQVAKHVARGGKCSRAFSCVDCSATFTSVNYSNHTSCISEAEKYEKTVYRGKPAKQNPQDAWMQLIMEAAASSGTAPQSISGFLNRLAELDNVPRNKNKFGNFVKNSLKLYNQQHIDSIWDFLEKLKANNQQKCEQESTGDNVDSVEISSHENIMPQEKHRKEPVESKKRKSESRDDDVGCKKSAHSAVAEVEAIDEKVKTDKKKKKDKKEKDKKKKDKNEKKEKRNRKEKEEE